LPLGEVTLGEVEHDRCRSLVEKLLDELHERVRILKAFPWVEFSELEEFSVALDAPIYPPRPYLLAFSPASDFHSGHAGLLRVRLEVCLLGVESAEVTAREDIATVARQLAALTQTVEEMAGQLKEVRERAASERERTDVQQERIDLAARELSDVSDRLQAAANALRESI
jgi:DNA-binding ferritin-like protein